MTTVKLYWQLRKKYLLAILAGMALVSVWMNVDDYKQFHYADTHFTQLFPEEKYNQAKELIAERAAKTPNKVVGDDERSASDTLVNGLAGTSGLYDQTYKELNQSLPTSYAQFKTDALSFYGDLAVEQNYGAFNIRGYQNHVIWTLDDYNSTFAFDTSYANVLLYSVLIFAGFALILLLDQSQQINAYLLQATRRRQNVLMAKMIWLLAVPTVALLALFGATLVWRQMAYEAQYLAVDWHVLLGIAGFFVSLGLLVGSYLFAIDSFIGRNWQKVGTAIAGGIAVLIGVSTTYNSSELRVALYGMTLKNTLLIFVLGALILLLAATYFWSRYSIESNHGYVRLRAWRWPFFIFVGAVAYLDFNWHSSLKIWWLTPIIMLVMLFLVTDFHPRDLLMKLHLGL